MVRGHTTINTNRVPLRSLIAYTKFAKQTQDSGEVEFFVNNKKVATQKYEKGQKGEIQMTDLEEFVKEGKQDLSVRFKGTKNALPYTVIDLETKLNTNRARVGETVRLTTTIKNKTNEGQAMTLGIVGLPAGLTAQPWQLKEILDEFKDWDSVETVVISQ